MALSTTPLGDDGAGLTEPTDSAYSRITVPNNKISFSTASNKIITIIKEFAFNESTVDWGSVTHFVMLDNLGNPWFYGALEHSMNVQALSSPIIDPNICTFTLDICGGGTADMAITTYAAHKILNYFLGNSPSLTPPTNYYIGVSSTPISTEGIGATEPTAGEYSRIAVPNDKNSFTDAVCHRRYLYIQK
jgi:hypothetical protein